MTSIMAAAGITRHAIPPTTQTLANALTFPPGTMYLDACNQLRESIGFSNLVATPDGRPLSFAVNRRCLYRTIPAVINTDISGTDPNPTNGHHRRKYRDGDSGQSERCPVVCDPTQRRDRQSDIDREPRSRCRERRHGRYKPIRMPWTLADRLLSEGRTFYQVASLRLLPGG